VHGPGVQNELCGVDKEPVVCLLGVIRTAALTGMVILAISVNSVLGTVIRDAFIESHDYKMCYCGRIYRGKVGTPVSRARFVADSI
jgi:hypothetical protein